MKKIEVVILPSRINDVKDALRKIGINKVTVSKVESSMVRPVTGGTAEVASMKVSMNQFF